MPCSRRSPPRTRTGKRVASAYRELLRAGSDVETQNEYERGAMGATRTVSQRATFDDIVTDWLAGTVPLAEAAAALRARIANLPAKREPARRGSKSQSVVQSESETASGTASVEESNARSSSS